MTNIRQVFGELRARSEGALIGYVMAGDPTAEYTPLIAEALIKGGVDILELGLPFSDPIADGPTIQAASVRALASGTTPRNVLEIARKIKQKHDIPIVIMTYYNPIFKMGLEEFLNLAKACSVDGLVIPDLPIEEAQEYGEKAKEYGIDTVFLAAPSTSPARLSKIIACTSGFLYLVSRFGVTGERTRVEDSTIQLVEKVLPFTKDLIPLAVGFGISKPEHVRSIIGAGAEGVVVGSAFVNTIQENSGDILKIAKELTDLASRLKEATKY